MLMQNFLFAGKKITKKNKIISLSDNAVLDKKSYLSLICVT